MPPSRGLALAALSLCLLAACGEQTEPDGGSGEPLSGGPGEWSTQHLDAEVGADQAPILATSGDDAVVLTVSEGGTLVSHHSNDGAAFETGEPLATGIDYLQLGGLVRLADGDWFTLGSGGSVESDGDTEFTFEAVALRSDDGLAWEQVEVSGFAHAVDVHDMTVAGDTVVVAGGYRLAENPSMGGFQAQVWTSTDAAAFTEADLPEVPEPRGFRGESYAGDVAQVGERLLVSGRVDRTAAVWASGNAGAGWVRVSDPALEEVYEVTSLAVAGDEVVAGVGEGKLPALVSTDGGDSWAPVEGLPERGETAWAPMWSDGARFWTLTGVDDTSWSEPEVCYADLDQCGKSPGPQLVVSDDAETWTAVDLPGEPDQVAGTADGRTLVLGADRDGPVVHELPAGTAPPEADTPAEPETVELVTLAEGEQPDVGVRYHAPMYLHCGMTWFWFGDTTWRRTDGGPDIETGAGDGAIEGWPYANGMLYGYATLTDADHLEYADEDGEVLATYRRNPNAPGCD
ncbi:hypothetical protein [Nocardioides ferulae]|uniref:hypothetical protein n=1 Tax=Nocardioides ferulae TaxID=2340821 RepID=UPI0013DDCE80|nr:hypothetical protein [Nocardioides ferulae]